MSPGVILSPRDLALLRLLHRTPLTVAQLRKVSVTFDGEPFRDERRVRERMQALSDAQLAKSFSAAVPSGGVMSYFRLTTEGYRAAYPDSADSLSRTSLAEIAPSRVHHTLVTADIIVHSLVACHERHVTVNRLLGDGQLTLEIGEHRQQPDFHLQLGYSGKSFNLLFEVDNSTEPLDSHREQSIRTKILGYQTYQNWVLSAWQNGGGIGARPAFRVVFLTIGSDRANHILWLAQQLANPATRRLVYATTQDTYLGEPAAVTAPILNDHFGFWQALVNDQPTSPILRAPVKLRPLVARNAFI